MLGHQLFLLHLDVNECDDNNGGCSDNCTNTEGTFNCDCPHGWKMGPNGFTCEGILTFEVQNSFTQLLLTVAVTFTKDDSFDHHDKVNI